MCFLCSQEQFLCSTIFSYAQKNPDSIREGCPSVLLTATSPTRSKTESHNKLGAQQVCVKQLREFRYFSLNIECLLYIRHQARHFAYAISFNPPLQIFNFVTFIIHILQIRKLRFRKLPLLMSTNPVNTRESTEPQDTFFHLTNAVRPRGTWKLVKWKVLNY